MEASRRELVWLVRQNFQGWGCSDCTWVFNPTGPPVGKSIDEMMIQYQQQRAKEFAAHVCAAHPRAAKTPR
jgi:hypothetical protein